MASNAIIQYGSSSSSSSHAIITASDVFVSFRGEDTLNNFTFFLFDALSQNGIDAFKDDTHLQKGESIAPELLQAIEESLLFLVVFSKNYASSTRCLRELAHICNCTDEASPSRVLPVFYDVDPSEVRKQSGYYGIAFAEHERRFREDIEKMEEVLRWREALTQVANISGWDIRNKSHPAMIKEIVQKIKYILGPKFQNFPNGNLVGMESRVEELEKCLALESVGDVRVVRISGIGGIGKTTLALAFTGGTDTLLSECLGEGSRIVIICKDEQLLRTHEVYHVYRVQPLNRHIAVQLFCKNAFKCDYIMSDYETLTHDVLSHAQGHPLAIEVISKSLHCRNVSQWRGRLVRLSDKVSKHTLKVLGIRSFCNPVRCLFPSFSIFSCIRELDLSFCNLLKIPDAFGNLHCLERISLSGNNFETLPSLKELSKLLSLDLRHCKRLKYLPELPSQTDWRPSDIRLSSLQDDESDDESDHLQLFYYTRSHFDVSNFDELKVESRFRDLYDQDLDVEVKKCGYDRVYVRDLEPSLNTRIGKRKRGFDYEDLIKDVPSSSSFTNDVFLSFRGEDTRYSFTGNLCRALRDSGIHTFVDDDELQRGDEITSELEKEIEDSRFFIIVLSQNYASSSFCLNVLAYILECVKRKRLLVLPIFYKVDPSSIRFHGGSFGEALANHEMKFKAKMDGLEHNMEKLEKWKMALHETANFSGYHFKQGDGYEYEFITRIVELVSSKIKQYPFHVGDYRVGLESYSEAFNYDVFLSFRGSDTLHGFTGYLYKALHDRGIHTFIDEDLKRGEEITPEIVKAIEESRIAIIVLSINYASSSFCLDELATILDCLERKRLLVLPVFYNVDHYQVLEGSYVEALVKHEESLKHSMEKLEKWEMALYEVADLSDFKIKHGARYEYDFIGEIVEWVSSKINPAHYPVGLGSKVLEVRKLLDVGRDDGVHMLGIHGIDGVGKSTLAREVYNKLISDHFDASCFIENVREKSKKHGLHHLQNILLSKILGEKDINLTSAQQVISMMQRHRLQQKKVLMVLDDVDRPEQLQAVTGKPAWFGPGSKVIITTQDKQLLTSYDINRTYEVKKLNKDDALQLLKWKAFKMHYFDPRYRMLLNRAVTFASSLPLTLEILASYLFGKSVKEWKFTFDQFVRSPNNPIEMILKVIFDSLKEKEKSVLLDIACYFKGYELTEVQDILHAHYGQCMKYYIDVLVDKSLVYISHGTEPCNDTITMHELIAKEIVRLESMMTKPGECRRLWSWEDVREVFLGYKTATSKIEIICLDYPIFDEEEIVQWDGTTFQNMQNLKTLIIRNGNFSKGPEYLPNSLRVFEWWGYPSHCLPSDFHPKELAICKLPCSRISTTELTNLLTKFVNVKRLKFSSEKV